MTMTEAVVWLEARGFELIAVIVAVGNLRPEGAIDSAFRFVHTDGPGFILTSTTINSLPE